MTLTDGRVGRATMRFWRNRRSALGGRIVHFPEDRSVGSFLLRPEEDSYEFLAYKSWWLRRENQWKPARGNVRVPVGQAMQLRVGNASGLPSGTATERNLSWLTDLEPDDVQILHLRCRDLTDREVGYLRVLTGLKYLDLSWCPITNASLSLLVTLKQLQMLDLSDDTKTTTEGREALEEALPGLLIVVW